jgi:hypothetical protein
MIQEKKSIIWEVRVQGSARKNVNMKMCVILNGYPDGAV